MARKRPLTKRSKIYSQTRELIMKVNKRIRSLEKGGNYNSWASKRLFERLDSSNLKVLNKARNKHILSIKINKNLSETQLIAIQKASVNFLRSETSSNRGIKNVEDSTKESMYKTLKNKNENISKQDIEDYYDMLSDKDLTHYVDNFGASTIWDIIEDAKEHNDNYNQFSDRINNYLEFGNDEDFKVRVQRIYNKYVNKI